MSTDQFDILNIKNTEATSKLNKAKEELILERIKNLGLLPIAERISKTISSDGEIWYYDYGTSDVKFIIYFKPISLSIGRDINRIDISIEYF